MMTRKDYVKTANILKGFSNEIHPQVYLDLVDVFADYFEADNDNFKREIFETACGLDELVVNH